MNELHLFREKLPPKGRLVGIDVGRKTLGIAISDVGRVIANPYRVIRRKTLTKDLTEIKKIIQDQEICGIVVGWPLELGGTESFACEFVGGFIERLIPEVDIPVTAFDERFSTAVVTREMISADLSRQRRGEIVDKAAAAYILQTCLDLLSRP